VMKDMQETTAPRSCVHSTATAMGPVSRVSATVRMAGSVLIAPRNLAEIALVMGLAPRLTGHALVIPVTLEKFANRRHAPGTPTANAHSRECASVVNASVSPDSLGMTAPVRARARLGAPVASCAPTEGNASEIAVSANHPGREMIATQRRAQANATPVAHVTMELVSVIHPSPGTSARLHHQMMGDATAE